MNTTTTATTATTITAATAASAAAASAAAITATAAAAAAAAAAATPALVGGLVEVGSEMVRGVASRVAPRHLRALGLDLWLLLRQVDFGQIDLRNTRLAPARMLPS